MENKEDIVGYLPTRSKIDQRSFCGAKFAQPYDRTAGGAETPTTHAKSFPGESQEESFLPDVAVEVEIITSDSRITKSSVPAIPLDSYGKHPNSDGITTGSRLAKKDSALKRIKSQNCILFFAYEVSEAVLHDVAARLKLRYSKLLTEDVTHVIYKTSVDNGEDHLAPFGWEYMFGLAKGLWQVSYQWIVKSLDHSRCLPLTAFEIKGCCEPTDDKYRLLNYRSFVGTNGIPGLARANREKGNPGLFDGFKFYFYPGNLNMENLECLAVHAGAKVISHEPTPENIDLLECSSRFHTYEDKNHQFSLTSHVIVYSDSKPPPETKKYNMANLKTLKLDWLVDSLGHFQLLDSESYFYNLYSHSL
ncbi:unnamed protein product [Orchesella dallaii]|uniref:BRCT domain-containing protein n=1 Tax=Orchesella dallaii TaxID=48710 RepID=A0ABP1PXU2_9HEXA